MLKWRYDICGLKTHSPPPFVSNFAHVSLSFVLATSFPAPRNLCPVELIQYNVLAAPRSLPSRSLKFDSSPNFPLARLDGLEHAIEDAMWSMHAAAATATTIGLSPNIARWR